MKKLMILAALAAIFAACRKEGEWPRDETVTTSLEIPEISWTWDKPGELRALCVYAGFEQDANTKKEVEELWHNAARIMIDYQSITEILKCTQTPGELEVKSLIKSLQTDSNYCDFAKLKGSIDYFLYRGKAVCVDNHEAIGYFLYTNGEGGARDESLFDNAYKQILLKELEIQEARFLQKNYAEQVKDGNICLEILNEPKDTRWEDPIQKYLAKKISDSFPELCLAIRPNQSYSSNCLRNSWFDPMDYAGIRHVTFVNFWFAERPDIGASPIDFAIQYDEFVLQRDSGVNVDFNIFGENVIGFYSHQEYILNLDLLEEEFKLCYDWAKDNEEKIFFAELGCIRYADPEGQYFLNCLKLGLKYEIGIALFEVGAKYFFNYDGDVPFFLNDPNWAGFKYLQMSPEEIEMQ